MEGIYHLGQPERLIEEFRVKRYYEYEVPSVRMSRIILEVLGWIKKRKGVLSLTVKGKKALSDIDAAANEILRVSLTKVGLHTLDAVEDETTGNMGTAYSVWLLNKFGSEWRTGDFYKNECMKVFKFPDIYRIYETRVFAQLFHWLGIVERRAYRRGEPIFTDEYKKTNLLTMVFSFKKV